MIHRTLEISFHSIKKRSLISAVHTMWCSFCHIDEDYIAEGDMENQVKTEPKESEDLNPSDCMLVKIKKEIEEDFAINEALLFDEESSREEEQKEVDLLVKQEAGIDHLEEGPGALDLVHYYHVDSCQGSEGFKGSLKVEDCGGECDTKLFQTEVSGGTESFGHPFDKDLAQQLSGIVPVPTLAKEPVVASCKEIKIKKEVKITRPSLKSFGGKNGPWWKPNVRRWWQRRKVEDLRGKIKGRWTALDSMPRRKEEVKTSSNREGGVLSRTFRRLGDNDKFKSAGWQREVLVGKTIETTCTRKGVSARSSGRREMNARSSDKPLRKRDSEEKFVSQERFPEKRDRSGGVKGVKETIQRRGVNKRDETVVVNVMAERGSQLENLQQIGKSHENHQRKERTMRRYSSTSTVSTASNISETKTATLDTSLGLLTQHPLLPNVFILDPKTQK